MVQAETHEDVKPSIDDEIDRLYESCKKLDYLINKLDFLMLELKLLTKKKL